MTLSKSLSVLFVFAVLWASCSPSGSEEKIEHEQFRIELTPKKAEIGLVGLPKIKSIDELLVTIDLKDTSVIKIYDKDLKLLGGKFKLGEFPLELEFPVFSSPQVFRNSVDNPIYDLGKLKLIDLQIKDPSSSNDISAKYQQVQGLSYFPKTIVFYSDSLAIYVPEVGGSLIFENRATQKVEVVPYQFHLFEKIKPANLSYVFQSVGAINLDEGLIVIAPILTGQVEFYKLNGEFQNSVTYDSTNHQKGFLDQVDFGNTDIIINAVDISVSPDFVYVLSSNNKVNQYLTGVRTNSSSVIKMDWNGTILGRYDLGVDASSFAVDEAQNRFYVTLNENDDTPIVYFDLDR